MKVVLLVFAVAGASPMAAAPTTPERPGNELVRDPVESVDADAVAFGRWLERVAMIEGRVQQQLTGLSAAWQEARAAGGSFRTQAGRLRAHVERALSEIDTADAEIGALELPEFAALELPEEVRPAALIPQIRALNRDIRALFVSMLPLVDATGPREMETAAGDMFSSLRLIFESQILLLRAHQAVTPREDVDWELISFEIGFLRGGLRIFDSFRLSQPQIDRRLSADLSAIADELEVNLRSARTKYAAEMAEQGEALAQAVRMGDQASAALLRRADNVRRLSQDYFPLVEQLSAHLRRSASLTRGRPLTPQLLAEIFAPMRAIRSGFDDIGLRQARALADTQGN